MLGLFVFIAFLVAVVAMYTKQGVAPWSPTTLVASVSTLADSPDMFKLLHGSGGNISSQMRERLGRHSFAAGHCGSGALRIKATETPTPDEGKMPSKPRDLVWRKSQADKKEGKASNVKRAWMPYPARKHAIAMTLSLLLLCIAVLEILWHLSETDMNFVTIPSDSSVAAYAIRYSSTALVLGIAALFHSLDFTIATLTPFSSLAAKRNNGVSGERTLLFDMVSDFPPMALYKAVRNRHVGAPLSLLASTIGSLLTIVISGVWFLDTSIQITQPATAQIQSGWRIDFSALNSTVNSTADSGVALFNEIQHGGTDRGSPIWGNSVVLPEVNLNEPSRPALSLDLEALNRDGESPPSYDFTVPAVQPILECSVVPSSSITKEESTSENHGFDSWYTGSQIYNITATVPLPDGCRFLSGTNQTGSILVSHSITTYHPDTFFDPNWRSHGTDENTHWIGLLGDLPIQPTSASGHGGSSSKGCPSLSAMLSRYVIDESTHSDGEHVFNYKAFILTCTQRRKSVEENISYHYTSLNINASTLTPRLAIPVQLSPSNHIPKNLVDPDPISPPSRTPWQVTLTVIRPPSYLALVKALITSSST